MEQVKQNNDCIKRMYALLETEFCWTEEQDSALRQSIEDQLNAAVEFGLKGTPMTAEEMETKLFAD